MKPDMIFKNGIHFFALALLAVSLSTQAQDTASFEQADAQIVAPAYDEVDFTEIDEDQDEPVEIVGERDIFLEDEDTQQ